MDHRMQATGLAYEESNGSPNSIESERAVLGAVIINNGLGRAVVERFHRDDFYLQSHRRIFLAMCELVKSGSEITPVLIGEELKKDHALELTGGISFITDLSKDGYGLANSGSVDYYAAHIKDSAARRQGMRLALAFIEKARDLNTPWSQSVQWIARESIGLDILSERGLVQTWKELNAQNLPTGDEIIHELERAELGLLNSVTNAGKSTLLRNLALSLASGRPFPNIAPYRKVRRVVLMDFETRKRRLQRDFKIMLQSFSTEEQRLVEENLGVVCDHLINDEPLNLSNEEHLRKVTAEIRARRVDLVIIDTVSAAFVVKDENSNSEVASKILKPLVRMAREIQAAVLVAHHVGKSSSEDGRTREQAYRGRGASAFGTFPSLVLDLVQDGSEKTRVTLSLAKSKGKKFEDVNLQLDKEARWFTVTGQPITVRRSSYELVDEIFDDGKPHKRHEIEAKLLGVVAKSTITDCLKKAIERGRIESIRRGHFQRPGNMLVVPTSIGHSTNSI